MSPADSDLLEAADATSLEGAIEEFITLRQRGAAPAIAEFAAKHPAHSAELAQLLGLVSELDAVSDTLTYDGVETTDIDSPPPERLGEFVILREIGRGGMGIVYEAVQTTPNRRVAVKVLPWGPLIGAKRLARFQREARIAGLLDHSHIVGVHSVGCDNGVHYLVMPLVDGRGLDHVIARTVTTTAEHWRRVAEIGQQVASALDHAHQRSALHRDIKPANLLVESSGRVLVTDFGLARAMESEDLSRSGELAGTLRYMAPEQFRGEVSPQSDLYALGLTLYEFATLRPAYDGANPSEVLQRIVAGPPPAPRTLVPAMPRSLEAILLKLIAREPVDRYATGAALAADLTAFLNGGPISARPLGRLERMRRVAMRNPVLVGLTALVVLLAGLLLAGWWNRPMPPGEPDFRQPTAPRPDLRLPPPFGPGLGPGPGRGPGPHFGPPPGQRPFNGPPRRGVGAV